MDHDLCTICFCHFATGDGPLCDKCSGADMWDANGNLK